MGICMGSLPGNKGARCQAGITALFALEFKSGMEDPEASESLLDLPFHPFEAGEIGFATVYMCIEDINVR
jgi:hypothetical protein